MAAKDNFIACIDVSISRLFVNKTSLNFSSVLITSHTLIWSKINKRDNLFAINVIFHVQMLPKQMFVNGKLWRISENNSPMHFILEHIRHKT